MQKGTNDSDKDEDAKNSAIIAWCIEMGIMGKKKSHTLEDFIVPRLHDDIQNNKKESSGMSPQDDCDNA